jgi:hypothetical protein
MVWDLVQNYFKWFIGENMHNCFKFITIYGPFCFENSWCSFVLEMYQATIKIKEDSF